MSGRLGSGMVHHEKGKAGGGYPFTSFLFFYIVVRYMYAVHTIDDRSTLGSNTSLSVHFILPMASQASLKNLWLHGNAGCLSARELARSGRVRKDWA